MAFETRPTGRIRARKESSDKAKLALKMRVAGRSIPEVAEALDVTPRWVSELIHTALVKNVEAEVTEYRAVELQRLEELHRRVMEKIEAALTDEDGQVDPKRLDLRAVDRVLRISERRSKLLGLDVPMRLEIEERNGPKVIDVDIWRPEVDGPDAPRLAAAPGASVEEQ